ncbi:MAG: Do family serine endopeptidase, partial [Betaproteobacteria bacterium]|nr:Do family serine endopeptidase [Betaproteobacteria bacterium]
MRVKHSVALACALLCLSLSLPIRAASLPDFTQLAKNCGIAVVNIGTERTSKSGPENFFGEMFRNAPPGFEKFFEQFDERFRDGQQQRPQRKQRSLGSGFIISEDGYIVTNYHVVADADVIRVNFQGNSQKNESVSAKLIGSDEETDLALLKVDVKDKLPSLKFGDSDALQVGAWVLAIGNPFGLDHTVTAGILSAKGRNIHSGPFDNFLQTDASINPGNSGGPLINMEGEVIGINTAIIASGQGIGFAIPSSMASKIVEQIKDGKKIRRGWIGVTIQDVDKNSAKALGLNKARGALIGSVMPGEPADKAGAKAGDIILSVDGKDIEDSNALLRTIAGKTPGAEIKIIVWRDGKSHELTL